jgi:hypothetical protein
MKINATNARAFQESGSVVSNIIRRVEVWGVDPDWKNDAGTVNIPLTMCRDATGFLYQVFQTSSMGNAIPQVGEWWLISRALGLWTFLSRLAVPTPITQTLAEGTHAYQMMPSNRFVFAFPNSGQTCTITMPNPISGVQGDVYGVRNTSGGGTNYTGTVNLAPFNNEQIHGPSVFGAHSGAMFVTDNHDWFCLGDSVASAGTQIGGA